jgi:uncharacterized protein YbgA (DUF1722 family)
MTGFMEAMATRATAARHAKSMRGLAAGLRVYLTVPEYGRVIGLIDEYRAGRVPLVVPQCLLGHLGILNEISGLVGLSYLYPHSNELMLRNHV